MRLRVLPNYLLAFAVRGKRKVGTLYSPTRGSYSDYHETQPIWIAEIGPESKIALEGVVVGTKGYVIDAYELEDLPDYLWTEYRARLPKEVVDQIEKEAFEFDGVITANIIHEDSVFAVEVSGGSERGHLHA